MIDFVKDSSKRGLFDSITLSNCSLRGEETLIELTKPSARLVIVVNCDIGKCKNIMLTDQLRVVIFINNNSEKWFRRFGIGLYFKNN